MELYQYQNQYGRTHYIRRWVDGNGRERFVAGQRRQHALRSLPEGYEMLEDPNGKVRIARRTRRLILEAEARMARDALERFAAWGFAADVRGRDITVFASTESQGWRAGTLDREFAEAVLGALRARFGDEVAGHLEERHARQATRRPHYVPLLKFHLACKRSRLYSVRRIYFSGDVDWLRLEEMALPAAVMKYIPHLGKDSFFELM